MIRPNLAATDSLSAEDLALVISARDRFESAWKSGRVRRIEDEVDAAHKSIRKRLFRELLALERKLRLHDGGHTDLDAYLVRFPDRAETVREVFAETMVTSDPESNPTRDESRDHTVTQGL